MAAHEAEQLANELIGSAHVLVAAVLSMKNAVLAKTAGKHLTFSQLKVLKLIDVGGPQHVGDIAAFLGVSDAAASKTVDRLVQEGYLRRSVGHTDRRRSELSLAAAGRKALAKYDSAKDRALGQIFDDIDPEEVRRTVEFLERLTRGIVNGSANPEEMCLQCGIYLKKRCVVREAARADCQYHRRRQSRKEASDATEAEISTRGGPGVGPPG